MLPIPPDQRPDDRSDKDRAASAVLKKILYAFLFFVLIGAIRAALGW